MTERIEKMHGPTHASSRNNAFTSSEVPRVLHVIGAMDRGGAETFIMNLYRTIDRKVIQFDFLVNEQRECDYDEEIRSLGGNIYSIPRFTGSNIISFYSACKSFFLLHHEYIAVHIHIGSSAALVIKAAKLFNLYTIAHSHACHFPLSPSELAFRAASYPTRFLADYYFACSQQAGIDRFGASVASGNRFRVISNGIPTESFKYNKDARNRIRTSLDINSDAPVLIHVGRLSPEKNHRFLLDVFHCIKQISAEATLLIVGRGPLESDLKQYAKLLEVDDSTLFLGIRNDVQDLLCASDILVFPSTSEGLAIAVIESQAAGLSCVVSSELPEESSVTDLVSRLSLNKSPEKWAEHIIEILSDDQTSERAGYAKLVAEAGFDIQRTAEFLSQFYLSHSSGSSLSQG